MYTLLKFTGEMNEAIRQEKDRPHRLLKKYIFDVNMRARALIYQFTVVPPPRVLPARMAMLPSDVVKRPAFS